MAPHTSPENHPPPSVRTKHRLREVILPALLFLGDAVCALAGLIAGYGMRFHTSIADLGIPVPGASLALYLPLLCFGAAMLLATFVYLGLYDPRLLLRRVYSMSLVIKGTTFWLAAFLGVSLVLKFDPPISRLLALVSFGTTLVVVYLWRTTFYLVISRRPLVDRLKQRVVLLGCDARARTFATEIAKHDAHPLAFAGFVGAPGEHAPAMLPHDQWLADFSGLSAALTTNDADMLVATTLDMPREELTRAIEICERSYADWKVIPSAFDLFVSHLQLETHGGVPVLGIGQLAIRRFFNRAAKRLLDIVGATIGLILGIPLMAIGALLVRRESRGPIIFRQTRIGAHHSTFTMFKLRTMHVGAESEDDSRQSTTTDDPRVLRHGRFLRRWNIDEMPQFWNVLRGDMSLVGPRPERPYHVDSLSRRIAHYLPRHLVKPGMTGWAQVNGFRGDSDLEQRLQLDIHYIERWSILFDLQILMLTFMRWRAPA